MLWPLPQSLYTVCPTFSSFIYDTAGMDPSAEMDKDSEYSFFGHITVKKKNVPIKNSDIVAFHILDVKCCFHP